MTRPRHACWLVLALASLCGCAQNGPIFSRRTTVGSLKTSLSRLEYENQQLRRQTASLQRENREFENRLVQEESLNGELSARLDDARVLLGDRESELAASPTRDPLEPGFGAPAKTLPAGRSTRGGRKPPFAQIPNRLQAVPHDDDQGDQSEFGASGGSGWRGETGPQSDRRDPTEWLPVARGTAPPAVRK